MSLEDDIQVLSTVIGDLQDDIAKLIAALDNLVSVIERRDWEGGREVTGRE